jgi:hypothetical protein
MVKQQHRQNPQRKQYKQEYYAKNREKLNAKRRLRCQKKSLIRIKKAVNDWKQRIGPAEVIHWEKQIALTKQKQQAFTIATIQHQPTAAPQSAPSVQMLRPSRRLILYSVKDFVSVEITGTESNKLWCEGQVFQVRRTHSNFLRYDVEYRTTENKTRRKLTNVKPDRVRPTERRVSSRRTSYLTHDDVVSQQMSPEVLGPSIPNQLTLRKGFLSVDEWNETNKYMKDIVESMLSHDPGNVSQLK